MSAPWLANGDQGLEGADLGCVRSKLKDREVLEVFLGRHVVAPAS